MPQSTHPCRRPPPPPPGAAAVDDRPRLSRGSHGRSGHRRAYSPDSGSRGDGSVRTLASALLAEQRTPLSLPTQRRAIDARPAGHARGTTQQDQQSLLERLDRPFAPGETITPRQTAIVAEAHGLPGITYSQAIVPGESGYQPGIENPDDATPCLFQITPSVQSAETQARFDRIASHHPGGYSNPIAAAKQARVLAGDSADEGVTNYVAFNPSAPQGHLPGGQRRPAEPTRRHARGSRRRECGTGTTAALDLGAVLRPGTSLVDNRPTGAIGGHGTQVHYGSENQRDVLTAAKIAGRLGLDVGRTRHLIRWTQFIRPTPCTTRRNRSTRTCVGLAQRADATGNQIGEALDISGNADAMMRSIGLARRSRAPWSRTRAGRWASRAPRPPTRAPLRYRLG